MASSTQDTDTSFKLSLPTVSLRLRPLHFIPVFILLGIVAWWVITGAQLQLEAQHLSNQTENLSIAYQQVLSGYERSAQIIYNEIIDRPEVLSLFAGAYGASEDEQTDIRQTLYDLLIADYRQLEELNLRQLHFHLPNNHSFLRFHRPERYGDDLTDIRYTIMVTNRDLVRTVGFEEGRIYNGFRYVFPLFWDGQHIGSVETSVSFLAIQGDLNQSLPGGTSFMLRADVVDAKVFEDEQSNYVITDISDTYVYDRPVMDAFVDDDISWETITAINTHFDATIAERMDNGETFAVGVRSHETDYIAAFKAVENVQGQQVGYVVAYEADDFLANSRASLRFSNFVIAMATIAAVAFVWYLDSSATFIERQRLQLANQNQQLTETNHALDIARQEALSANQLKSQFLANMSHELRTPLNAIINFSRFVAEGMFGEVNDEQVETLGKVTDNGEYLLTMVNDLLDISKIEAGQLKLFIEDDLDLHKTVHNVADIGRLLLADKPVETVVLIDEPIPLIVGDRRRIRQIMLNLVSNACKFTDSGSVRLRLSADADYVTFSVSDTGAGIAAEDHESIFETFHQTDMGIKQGGTGLGLPISRSLAQIHDGRLTLTSVQGEGTTFMLRLPQRNPALLKQKAKQDALLPDYNRGV